MSGVAPSRPEGSAFRPELEGLRAVAVVLVLLYHASVPLVSGGFVGVDVFFVLSGFLITGLIVRELEGTGRLDLPGFYARRARRLLPAAAVTIVVTILLSAVLLPPLRVPDVAGDAAASALYVANLRFALQATDYLAAELDPSPLLHFWSLGVEEQFYLVWPALLFGTFLVARRLGLGGAGVPAAVASAGGAAPDPTAGLLRRRLPLIVLVGLVSLVSFALAVWLTRVNQPWAFFSLPTRAWELGLGALLALGTPWLARLGGAVGGAAMALGLLAIGASGVVLDTGTAFPGTAALLPTLGAALVIGGALAGPGTLPARLLSAPVPRFVGRISYSLYLWHWPFVVLPAAAVETPLPLAARLALVGLSVVAAWASHRWVEEPIRHGGGWVGHRTARTLALAGAATVVVAVVSIGVGRFALLTLPGAVNGSTDIDDPSVLPSDPLGGLPTTAPSASPDPSGSPRPSALPATPGGPVPRDLLPPLATARESLPVIYSDGCHLELEATTFGECAYGDPASATTVVLIGDSHGAQWFPTFQRLATVEGWRLVSLTKSACAVADVPIRNIALGRAYTECDAWREAALRRIEAERPALVVLTNARTHLLDLPEGPTAAADAPDVWDAGLRRTLERVGAATDRLVLLGDTPRSAVDPPVCLSEHLDDVLACATDPARALAPERTARDATLAADTGVGFVDPTAWVCPSDPCPAVIGRFLVYRDEHHLATPFATALAARTRDALERADALPAGS